MENVPSAVAPSDGVDGVKFDGTDGGLRRHDIIPGEDADRNGDREIGLIGDGHLHGGAVGKA